MGLLDKLKGTRQAKPGPAPIPAEELRSALLDLNGDSASWRLRDGTQEGWNLVAEWRIIDTGWRGSLIERHGSVFAYGLSKAFRVKMKFDEEAHQVRNVDEETTVEWRGGVPYVSNSWSRGHINEVQSGRAVLFTEAGEPGQVYKYKFRSSEIKDPLRDVVTEHGWGWKTLSFKL